ncbi:outer membrane protein [Nitrospina sp. 32_T5]|uniref:outer membrane protein n=1 Tax=unclassified Nitrospina TaxID=2638683 RepID=UPI003F9CD5C2
MKRIVSLALVSVFFLSSPAIGAPQNYFVAKVGFNHTPNTQIGTERIDIFPGYTLLGGFGVQFDLPIRFEAEFSYMHHNFNFERRSPGNTYLDGSYKAFNSMGNVLFDLNGKGTLNPYIGAGVGLSLVEMSLEKSNEPDDDDYDLEPAAQGIAGLELKSGNRKSALILEYRYFVVDGPDHQFSGFGGGTELKSHQVFLGFRYTLDLR